jgi:hypothetical protein
MIAGPTLVTLLRIGLIPGGQPVERAAKFKSSGAVQIVVRLVLDLTHIHIVAAAANL